MSKQLGWSGRLVSKCMHWKVSAHLWKLALVWEYTRLGPLFMDQQPPAADAGSEKSASPWSELPHSRNPPSYPIHCRDSTSESGAPSPAFGPPSKASQGGTGNPRQRLCLWEAGFNTQQHSFDRELLPKWGTSAPLWEGRQLWALASSLRGTVSWFREFNHSKINRWFVGPVFMCMDASS